VDLSLFRLSSFSPPFYLWHSHLGHVSASRLKFLAFVGVLGTLDNHDISYSSCYKLAKCSNLPFNESISSSLAPFDLVDFDVWGPSPLSTKDRSRYYVSFIDDFTHFTWIYLMKCRFDYLTILIKFSALVKTHHHFATIQTFRCDLGEKYTSNDFTTLFASNETIHLASCTNTPQHNGVVERKYHHLVETTR